MSRYTLRKVCAEPGCKEIAFFGYDTQRELRASTYRSRDWLCTRHAYPDEVLSAWNPTTEHVMVSKRGAADRLYWNGSSGFTFGPGFKAFADDFPEGARLVVTAHVELPASPQKPEDGGQHG